MHSAQNNAKRSEGEENISNDMDDNVDSGVCVGGGGQQRKRDTGQSHFHNWGAYTELRGRSFLITIPYNPTLGREKTVQNQDDERTAQGEQRGLWLRGRRR